MFIISVILFLIVSLISCGEGADQNITITKQQISSEYKIVILGTTQEEKFAGKTLANYIKIIINNEIEILNSLDGDILEGKYIIIGLEKNRYIRDVLGIRNIALSDQGFAIIKFDDDIVIIGKSPIGVIYGIYYFLEDYIGIKFLSHDYTYIPKDIEIRLSKNIDIQNPRFSYREIFIRESDNPEFSLKRKLNGRLGHRNNTPLEYGNKFVKLHGIYDLVPPHIYKKDHPEFFCGGQLDFTHPIVKQIAVNNAKKILEKYKNIKEKFYFVIGNVDGGHFCYNERSKKRIEEGGAPSTPYLDFVVFLAENLKDKYPNAIFTASAYLWSRKPPKNYQKLPDNVAIFFSDIEADFSKPIYHKKNKEIFSDLKGWTKLTDHILIWHYITNFNNYFQPYPNIYTVAENIKTYSKIKQIKGVFLQGSYGTLYGDMSDLRIYVYSNLLWNPKLDTQYLIDTFLKNFYGEAFPFIKDYFNLLYDSFEKNHIILQPKTPINVPYLNAEFFINGENLLSQALEHVEKNSIFEKNIRKLKFGLDINLLVNRAYLEREAKEKGLSWFDKQYIQKLTHEVEKFIRENNIKTFSEGGKIEDLLTLINIERSTIKYPKVLGNYTYEKDWFDYQEYMLQICCGARFEIDEKASDNVAVTMPGSTTAWGISLDLDFLPEGKWTVYFSIRVEPSQNFSLNDVAFRYGVYKKTGVKEVKLLEVVDGKYHTIKVGTFKRSDGNLWIAPPGNRSVKKIYVDRVFIIRD